MLPGTFSACFYNQGSSNKHRSKNYEKKDLQYKNNHALFLFNLLPISCRTTNNRFTTFHFSLFTLNISRFFSSTQTVLLWKGSARPYHNRTLGSGCHRALLQVSWQLLPARRRKKSPPECP